MTFERAVELHFSVLSRAKKKHYSRMKILFLPIVVGASLTLCSPILQAAGHDWAGEYADKKFLSGSAVFQLTIEQSGSKIQVSFDAAKNNGQGCTPETQTIAKETAKGLEFTFRDNQGNGGTGQIVRSGDDLMVSLKPTKVANKDCVGFYRENIRVKRMSK